MAKKTIKINPKRGQRPTVLLGEIVTPEDQLRPCWVNGRKALFHRWVNNAHPVLPRGAELNENNRYFQFRRTEALVEYEDGTVGRIYPDAVQFADGGGGRFQDWAWTPATQEAEYGGN